MKKKSIQRIAAWLLAAGMMAGTFAQPMAVYAESTASIAASDSTTGDSITADADVVIATPTPEPDTGTDTAATPVPTADSQTPQDPASTAAPETTPAPDAAEDAPTPTPTPTPTPAAEDTADDAADTDDTTDTTTTVTPADLQSCIALLAASQLSLDADSIEPDVREETLALSDEITETEPSTRRRGSMRRCMRPRTARPTLWSMCPPPITPARWSFPMQPSSARTTEATRSTSTTQTKTSS